LLPMSPSWNLSYVNKCCHAAGWSPFRQFPMSFLPNLSTRSWEASYCSTVD
jgi:hypothetical protein